MEEGFSFPCPNSAQSDVAFENFLKTDPRNIYDPFPQIARRQNFSQPRTQPLARIYYLASTDPLKDELEFHFGIKFAHESGHINNDDTPAKCWARYLHGSRLQKLHTILWAESWNAKAVESWDSLVEINKLLSVIANRICLSEELMATAESFVKLEQVVDAHSFLAHWRRKLGCLEEEAVEYFASEERQPQFPDFGPLYGTIKKAITWAMLDESGLLNPSLRIFLQGLHMEDNLDNWTVDSHQQCLLLAEQVKRMDNPAQLSDWLMEMIHQEDLYQSGLVFDLKLAKDTKGTVLEALWQVTHRGPKSPEGLYGPIPKNLSFNSKDYLFSKSRLHIFIFPRLLGSQWYIQPSVLLERENTMCVETKYLESDPVMVLLKLEALLEQVTARDGICCPYYRYSPDSPEACECHQSWKRALVRILQWGREGKFGPGGTWRDLPPECSCGV
jgi:hypothetical protein